jgi:hypothetical protein
MNEKGRIVHNKFILFMGAVFPMYFLSVAGMPTVI